MRTTMVILIGCLLIAFVNAQTPARLSFDVATVKAEAAVQPGESYSANLGSIRNGRLTMGNVTLSDAIKFAYGIVSDNQVAGPDWIKSRDVRFAIVGQASPDTPQDRIGGAVRRGFAVVTGRVEGQNGSGRRSYLRERPSGRCEPAFSLHRSSRATRLAIGFPKRPG